MAKLEIVRKRPLDINGDSETVIAGIEIHDSDRKVFGSAYIPKNAMDLVNVFCPGVGINHYHAKHYLKRILPKDMGTLMITPTGHFPSNGEYNPSLNVEYIDLLIENVPRLFLTDRVILSGHSGGGRDALGAAAIRDDLEGLLLFSPAYDIYKAMTRDWAYLLFSKVPNLTGPVVRKVVNKGWKLEEIENWSKFRIRNFNDLVDNVKSVPKAGDYAEKISCPVLIFHGTEDDRIPFEDSEKLTNELKEYGVDVELVKMEGATHKPFIEEEALKIMKPKIREWLDMIQRKSQSSPNFWEKIKIGLKKYSQSWIQKRLKDNYF